MVDHHAALVAAAALFDDDHDYGETAHFSSALTDAAPPA